MHVVSAITDVVETAITNKSSEDGESSKRVPCYLLRQQQINSYDTKEQVKDALPVNKDSSISGNFNKEEIEQKDLIVNLLTNKDFAENSQFDETKKSMKMDREEETKISVSVNLTEEDVTNNTSVIQSAIPDVGNQSITVSTINNNTASSEVQDTKPKIIIGVANKSKRTKTKKKKVMAANATTLPAITKVTLNLPNSNTNHLKAPSNVLKVYTREVLLAMRKYPASFMKPDNVPENILKKDHRLNNIKLNQAGNAWNPARFPALGELSEQEKKTAELYRKFNEILNKLTPEKFDTLRTEVQDLNIDTCEKLQGIIDLVFEKVADDSKLGSMCLYSSLCRELTVVQVALNDAGQAEFVSFKKLLVIRCQVEFEKSNAHEKLKSSKIDEIENCFDFDKWKELQTELEENEFQFKRKYFGTIRFMGELFKMEMISVSIMLRCLKELLQDKSEKNFEYLCTLLAIAGELLNKTNQSDLNMILKEMRDIVEKRPTGISNGIRFMLQDNIELLLSDRVVLHNLEVDEIENSDDSDMAPLVFENCISLNDLSTLLDEESKNKFGTKLLGAICRTIITENDDEKDHAVIGPLLRDSNTKLSNFTPESQINKFIEENKFHFLNAPQPRISMKLLKRLSKLFADNTSFEDITDWISKNVGDAVQENQFIRTLATAIFDFSIVNEKLKAEILADKYCYFLRYVGNNPNLQLQCLFALQTLINKLGHPQGILLNICNKLSEDKIFSHKSFLVWEYILNSDPLEQEGKGDTLKQLMAFFMDL